MKALKSSIWPLMLFNFFAFGALATGVAVAATQAAKPAAAKPAAGKPAAKPAPGKQVNGKQLLAESKKAVAGILKASKASGGKLDPKNKKQAPFFGGIKELRASIADSEKKMKAKDKKLFDSLSKGSTALAKVKTAWPRTGVKDAKVDGYLGKLDNSYTALRARYGSEGLRAKQGGALSAKEKANFEKIKASQAEFANKLAPMQAKAKKNGDKGTEAELARLIAQSNKISTAQLSVDAFLTAMVLVDVLQGEWDCYSYYVGPDYRADWVQVDVWVEASFTSYDTMYWETVDTYSVESWDYWDASMELDLDVDFTVADISDADLSSSDSYLDSSYSYDELSWEDYSTEYASAEAQDTVYEEEDLNLDVAEEAWEDEGLELEAADDMLDADDAEDAADDDDGADGEADDDAADDAADDDGADDAADDDGADDADDDGGDDADDDADDDGGDDDADDDGGDDGGDDDDGGEEVSLS
ncbi:MAG: hypothetical protein ABI689_12925 [Thermoanaerobaculia bacterium]